MLECVLLWLRVRSALPIRLAIVSQIITPLYPVRTNTLYSVNLPGILTDIMPEQWPCGMDVPSGHGAHCMPVVDELGLYSRQLRKRRTSFAYSLASYRHSTLYLHVRAFLYL